MTSPLKGQCAFVSFPDAPPAEILAADVYTVDDAAKSQLLSKAVPFSEDYKDTAKKVLGYLHELYEGSLDEVFTLKSDDVSQVPLRLLNPGKESPDVEDSFLTASYCWMASEPAWPEQETPTKHEANKVERESYPLPMSPLMYQALLHERKSTREGVWIDQVCIDQTSAAEKQIAVNAMDIIYKSARAVVILLDDIQVLSSEQDFLSSYIVEFESTNYMPHHHERPPFMQKHPIMRNFFIRMIEARWFDRAWCAHEMRLGPEHIFLIRCQSDNQLRNGIRTPPTVLRFTGLFMIHLLALAMPADLAMPRIRSLLLVFGKAILQQRGADDFVQSRMQVFSDTFSQNAGGNPELEGLARDYDANLDKLAIVVNTIGLGLSVTRAISADKTETKMGSSDQALPPATEDECCRRFTGLAIASGDLTALCTTGTQLRLGGDQSRTWMRRPVFTDIDTNAQGDDMITSFDIDFDASPAAQYVGLDVCFYNGDGPGAGNSGMRWASERKLRISRAFKEGCERQRIYAVNFRYAEGETLKSNDLRKMVIRTIAAILECGLDWLRAMSEHAVLGLDTWDLTTLVKAMKRLLNHEEESLANGKPMEPFNTDYLGSQAGRREAEMLLDLARTLIHNCLPWDSEKSMSAYEPVCLVNHGEKLGFAKGGGGAMGIMFARIPDNGSNVDVVCATPVILLQERFGSLYRGWTLVKGSPEREQDKSGVWKWKYHLVGKSKIIGMTPAYAGFQAAGDQPKGDRPKDEEAKSDQTKSAQPTDNQLGSMKPLGERAGRCGKVSREIRLYGPKEDMV